MKEKIINELREDHRQLMKVLYQLDQHLLDIKRKGWKNPPLESLLNILDYIQVYPETWHHPAEDMIFSHLLDKVSSHNSEQASEIVNIIEEHGILEELTIALQEMFQQLAVGQEPVPVQKLSRMAHYYITTQLKHIEKEQNRIFPMVSAWFEESDWQEISIKLEKFFADRPGSPEKEEYHTLVHHLLEKHPVTANQR